MGEGERSLRMMKTLERNARQLVFLADYYLLLLLHLHEFIYFNEKRKKKVHMHVLKELKVSLWSLSISINLVNIKPISLSYY